MLKPYKNSAGLKNKESLTPEVLERKHKEHAARQKQIKYDKRTKILEISDEKVKARAVVITAEKQRATKATIARIVRKRKDEENNIRNRTIANVNID